MIFVPQPYPLWAGTESTYTAEGLRNLALLDAAELREYAEGRVDLVIGWQYDPAEAGEIPAPVTFRYGVLSGDVANVGPVRAEVAMALLESVQLTRELYAAGQMIGSDEATR